MSTQTAQKDAALHEATAMERPTANLADTDTDTDVMAALDTLTSATDALSRAPIGPDASLAALAHVMHAVDTVRRDLERLKDSAIRAAAQHPHEKETIVPGVGVLSFAYKSSKTIWQHDALLEAMLNEARLDKASGEMQDAPDAERLLHLLTDCARIDWRVTNLRANLSCFDDEFEEEVRHVEKGALTARIQ